MSSVHHLLGFACFVYSTRCDPISHPFWSWSRLKSIRELPCVLVILTLGQSSQASWSCVRVWGQILLHTLGAVASLSVLLLTGGHRDAVQGLGQSPDTSPHGCSKSSRCRSPALSAHACGPCVGSCHLRAKYNLSHPMATAVRESRAFLPLPGPRLRETLCLDTLTGRWQLAVPEVPRPAPMETACQLQWPLAQLVMWRQQRELRDARFARWRVQ